MSRRKPRRSGGARRRDREIRTDVIAFDRQGAYLTGMNAMTKVSAKGQVVIPKAVRDRLHWTSGTPLEVIDGPNGVTLRKTSAGREDFDWDAWRKEMREIVAYDGPRYDDKHFNDAIDEMFRTGDGVTA